MVTEYRDLVEALQGSDYHRFRLTMKTCAIVPPSSPGEYYGDPEGEEAAGNEPLDPVLEGICMKALAKRPEDRFPVAGSSGRRSIPTWKGRRSRNGMGLNLKGPR